MARNGINNIDGQQISDLYTNIKYDKCEREIDGKSLRYETQYIHRLNAWDFPSGLLSFDMCAIQKAFWETYVWPNK